MALGLGVPVAGTAVDAWPLPPDTAPSWWHPTTRTRSPGAAFDVTAFLSEVAGTGAMVQARIMFTRNPQVLEHPGRSSSPPA